MMSCIAPTCKDNEKVLENGTCLPCDDHTFLAPDKHSCLSPFCKGVNEYISKNGTCEKCKDYFRPTKNK